MSENIEVEIRSLITKEKYTELIKFFKTKAKILRSEKQVTYYFNSPQDLRIQYNDNYSKVWLKKGQLHDEHREEIEIRLPKKDFTLLEKLFTALGYKIEIKWFRHRTEFKWKGMSIALDFTKGYGYIIEIEIMSSNKEKAKSIEKIKKTFMDLGIEITPREVFEEKYNYYKKNWTKLV